MGVKPVQGGFSLDHVFDKAANSANNAEKTHHCETCLANPTIETEKKDHQRDTEYDSDSNEPVVGKAHHVDYVAER